ncbi:MAG TPA: ABC transporter permease [Anaerolineae bacterium]|jgi:ABC-2 type transport system permease protein
MRRFRALLKKEITHMQRDPRTVITILIMPILQLVLLGYATNTEVKNVPTVVYDQSNSASSRALLDAYSSTGYFTFDHIVHNEQELDLLIEGGQDKVGIIIPPSFSSDLSAGHGTEIAVLIDGSDPVVASTAMANATLVGQAHGASIRLEQLAARGTNVGATTPVEVQSRVLYNPNLESSYNMIPGLIAMILMQTTTTLTSAAIVKEREIGTIEQLIVTPIRNYELIIAKMVPYVLVSLINVIVILAVGTLWFHVPIRGSFYLLFALTGLYLLPNLAIGLLVSTVAKTQRQAQMLIMPIMLPSMMLSGFFYPLAALPAVLQFVSSLLPMTYFLVIVRSVVIKGAGIELLMPQVIALTVFSVVLLAVAASRFRKSLD